MASLGARKLNAKIWLFYLVSGTPVNIQINLKIILKEFENCLEREKAIAMGL